MMRYARSGHHDRSAELQQKQLERVDLPTTRRRGVAIAAAVVMPVVIALAVTIARKPTPTPPPALPPPVVVQAEKPAPPPEPAPPPPDPTQHDTLRAGEALGSALARHSVGADDVSNLVRDLKGVLEVRSLRVGAAFSVLVEDAHLSRFTFKTTTAEGLPRTIVAMRLTDVDAVDGTDESAAGSARKAQPSRRFDVLVEDAAVDVVVEGLVGNVRGSLYNGVLDAGGDANLVNKFVDVFAWNVDFYRQTQPNDEFRVLVEKKYAGEGEDRRFVGWGKVIAAEYINAGTSFRGFAFETADHAVGGFYDEAGDSLERTFLRNPMEVTRITSSYGMRFHPVLKREKRHEGIDYGAPVGTPIWTVADGVVTEARYSSSAGNMVTVQHINGYKTEYFHMSRFADGLKAGARVKQKQLIGYVGSTGRSTGPHLHFGMLRAGSHIDPAKQKFPNAKPIPAKYRAEFDAFVGPWLAQLQALTRA